MLIYRSCNCDGVFGQVVSPKDTPRHGCHAIARPVSVWLCLLSIIGLNPKKIRKEIRIIHSLIIPVNDFLFPVSHYARKALAVSLSLRINRIFFYPDSERMNDSFALALFHLPRCPDQNSGCLTKATPKIRPKRLNDSPMRKIFSILLMFALPIFSLAQSNTRPQTQPLVMTHVTIIDATGARPKPDQTIVIVAGRIREIGKSSAVRVPRGAQVLDATGKFLIPGLWDMHVHLAGVSANPAWSKEVVLPLYVANGVTGVRDMGSDLKLVQQWRKEISDGLLPGPRIVTPGPMLTTRKSNQPEMSAVQNESEARETVRSLKNRGADFIKVISLARESYMALADESKKEQHAVRRSCA